jgi:peptide chain release factor 2
MKEYKPKLEELEAQVKAGLEVIDLAKLKERFKILQQQMTEENFWNDPVEAAEVSKEASFLQDEIGEWEGILEDIQSLLEMTEIVKEEHSAQEKLEFEKLIVGLEDRWKALNVSTFLSGEYDKNNAILTVICGTGGKDAQDFTKILFRMYQRYVESRGWKVEVLDVSEAEAGLKQATIKVVGMYAFGYLKYEHGVHRLVRLSPFNSGNTRETSFAKVDVLPEMHFKDHVNIDEADLKIDVFRSSGAGGQSVNTTDSAVRITHLPTNIVVTCQNERSQLQNKQEAMKILQGKLHVLMREKQAQTLDDLRGLKSEVSWGNQIRSYVLHPYKMIKDHRTMFEHNNPDLVLDGDLQGFIERELEILSPKMAY